MLGDLSERSAFELDDPAGAFGEAGTLTVRVTGAEVDPNFGPSSVFVTARATGVLGE